MKTAVVLFTRDLRVHDNPPLAEAHRVAEQVVPLFVLDDGILGGNFSAPNRIRFLLESLTDLRQSLRARGADLLIRRGQTATEVVDIARQVGAEAVFTGGDVTGYAQARQTRLAEACHEQRIPLTIIADTTVVPPEALEPGNGDHYKVFTPFYRAWLRVGRRPILAAPRKLKLPAGLDAGDIPTRESLVDGPVSPRAVPGGESEGRSRMAAWLKGGLGSYGDRNDYLAEAGTSRLSPYLHFGCLSASELVKEAQGRHGAEPFVRQLCWRDFHHQVTASFPRIASEDYRPRGDEWHHNEDALRAWKDGRTGYPIVDAGMRQLAEEGWMHNRARLVVASFLTKDLYIDWRDGAAHFLEWLIDGDIANNSGNWQWVAGTGNDTRPNRVLNPLRQAMKFDPDGEYVRRYVPELRSVAGKAVHEPWKIGPLERDSIDYPERLVVHEEVASSFRHRG